MYIVQEEVRGYMDRDLWAAAGAMVEIVAYYGTVVVVENEKKVRFPCTRLNLEKEVMPPLISGIELPTVLEAEKPAVLPVTAKRKNRRAEKPVKQENPSF